MRPILLIMCTAFQSFILRHNNTTNNNNNDNNNNNNNNNSNFFFQFKKHTLLNSSQIES